MTPIPPVDHKTSVPEPAMRELVLVDANSGDSTHPYLVFDAESGTLVIADDFETANDRTARDFVVSKRDAVALAFNLLHYVLYGQTTTARSTSQYDVADRLAGEE
jgi:hypothetical protein